MKIVNIIGGLGNQMFQYAFAIALQAAFPKEVVKLNISSFKGYPLHNGFELEALFVIKLHYASVKELCKVAYPWIHYRLWQIGKKILPRRKCMVWENDCSGDFNFNQFEKKYYFDGYWQSPKYFDKYRKDVLTAFKFPKITDHKNLEAIEFIKSGRTAFVHVRRGDYINHPLFKGICDKKYYHEGIELLVNKYKFDNILIFSNDIEWCEFNLNAFLYKIPHKYVYWNQCQDSFRDMQLMSLCQGALIANSSFSWWGAWLGEMKTVIAPKRWTNNPAILQDILPFDWIRI